MKIACIYWNSNSVGGIATHLNALRKASIQRKDTFDILHCFLWKTKNPQLFPDRKSVTGGNVRIWVDGEISNHETKIDATVKWLNDNYEAIHFGYLCPHRRKDYPNPTFIPMFTQTDLPKTATITDGYWKEYADWGRLCLPHLNYISTSGLYYAEELRAEGIEVEHLGMPFVPPKTKPAVRSATPLLVWPNQWKNIKGVAKFCSIIPKLNPKVSVELYSSGIRYFQLRNEPEWLTQTVKEDRLAGTTGTGRAVFFGHVELPVIQNAMQRAWFTVNLQGMKATKPAYQRGSYNNTELEALYFGAIPILYKTAVNTDLPKGTFLTVESAEEIPDVVNRAIKDRMHLNPKRQATGREFVLDNYSAHVQYHKLRKHWQ